MVVVPPRIASTDVLLAVLRDIVEYKAIFKIGIVTYPIPYRLGP